MRGFTSFNTSLTNTVLDSKPDVTAPHIGIVGCSAEGAALCYRTICLEGSIFFGEHGHPEVSMHTHSLAEYIDKIKKDDWQGVGDLMLSSANCLKKSGARILICPDNTIHQIFPYVEEKSPLPWIHITTPVIERAKELKLTHLGVLGTKFLMEGPVYQDALAKAQLKCTIPDQLDREKINQIIFDELVKGKITDSSREFFSLVIDKLKLKGCDGVVLGCTEIPLIVDQSASSLPILDSTRLLARAALKWASFALEDMPDEKPQSLKPKS